jgi:restriction endonuclease S subunit
MEVKPGYKQSELGVIPEEWEVVTLDACLDLLTDFEANGSFEDTARNVRAYDVEDFAWYVRATDLENETPVNSVRYVDRGSYDFLKKTGLFGGEVLITKRGEIGKVYLFKKKTAHATLAPNLYLLKLNSQALPEYVFAYFRYGNGNRTLRNINASTTLGALYKNDVKAITLPLPPLQGQRAIAEVLADVDALIGALDQFIAKKRDLKQAAMQQLLTGQARLSGFTGMWEVKRLGDVVQIKKGQLITEKDAHPGTVPVIAGGMKPAYYHNRANHSGKTITVSGSGANAGFVAFHNVPIFASDCSTISEADDYRKTRADLPSSDRWSAAAHTPGGPDANRNRRAARRGTTSHRRRPLRHGR